MGEQNEKGRGLTMLRLEASRYKLEMQRIRMQGHLHHHRQSIQSQHFETPKPTTSSAPLGFQIQEESPEPTANSQGPEIKPLLVNRADVDVPQPKQLANVEEGTQTDNNSKEAETETEEPWVFGEQKHTTSDGTEEPKASEQPATESHTCRKHYEEQNKQIDDIPDADLHKCHNYRVNATVVFTANPSQVAVEDEFVSPLHTSTTTSAGKGKIKNACEIEIETESLSGGSNNAWNRTMADAKLEELLSTASGLRALISSLPHNYSTCLPTFATAYDRGKRHGSFGNEEKANFSADNHRRKDFPAPNCQVPADCNWSLYNVARSDSNQRLGGRQRASYAHQEDPIKEHVSVNRGVQADIIRGGTSISTLTAQGIDCKPGARRNISSAECASHTMHYASTCRSRSTDWSFGVQDPETFGGTHGHKCLTCGEMCCALKKYEKPCLAAHSCDLPKGIPRSEDESSENTNQRLQVKSCAQKLRCACECQARWSHGDAKLVEKDGVSDLASPFHESCSIVDPMPLRITHGVATRTQHCPNCQNVLKSGQERIQNVVSDNCHLCSSHYNEERDTLRSCTSGTEYQPEDRPLNEITIEFPDGLEGEANIMLSRNERFEPPCYNVEVSATHDTPKQNQAEEVVVSHQVCPPKYNCCDPVFTQGSASWKDGCRVECMRAPASSNNNHRNTGNMRSPFKCFDNGGHEPSHAGRRYVRHFKTPLRFDCKANNTSFNHKDPLPVEMPCIHQHHEKKELTTLSKNLQDRHCKKFHADFDHKNPPVEHSRIWHSHEGNELTSGKTNHMEHKKSHAELDHKNSLVATPSKLRHLEVKEFTLGKNQDMHCKKSHLGFDQKDPPVGTPSIPHQHGVRDCTLGKSQDMHCKKLHLDFDQKDPRVGTPSILHQRGVRDFTLGKSQNMHCEKLHLEFVQKDPHVGTSSNFHHLEAKDFAPGKSQDMHCKKFHSNFDHKDPHVETSCSLHHHDRKILSVGRAQDMHKKGFRRHTSDNLDDDDQGSGVSLSKRNQKSPHVPFKNNCSKDHSEIVPEMSSVDTRNLCRAHVDRERSQTSRTDSESPTKRLDKELGECSHTKGNEANHFATKVISKTHSDSVEEFTANPSMSRLNSRVQPLLLPDQAVRAGAAAEGLVKEIEIMMGAATTTTLKQPLHKTQHSLSLRHKPQSEEQKEPYRQTKLDRAVVAAVQAVNKLEKIPMMSRVTIDAAPPRAAAQKGRAPPERALNEVTVGGGFYDQMHQELKELVLERMKLLRQDQACFQTAFLLSPHQQHKELLCKGGTTDTTNQRSLPAINSDEDESAKGVREKMRTTSEEFQTLGSKRQRNANSPAREHANKLLRLSAGRVEASRSGKDLLDRNVVALSSSLNEPADRMMRIGDPVKKFRFERPDVRFRVSKGGEENITGRPSSACCGGSVSAVIHRPPASWSFGKWKPLNDKPRKGNSSRWKFKAPSWVDRMTQGRDIFYGLRPLAAAIAQDEDFAKAFIKRRNLRPPGSIFKTLNKQFLGHLTRSGGVLSTVYSEPEKLHKKNDVPNSSIQYDIATGRRLVPGQDPEVTSENKQEEKKQYLKGKIRSPVQRVSVLKRQSDVEGGQITHGVAESGQNNSRRLKGWNSDPCLISDIPHKPSDIVRYNRFDLRMEQARKLGRKKSNKVEEGINLRHVTFASMDVHLEGRGPKSQKMDPALHHAQGGLLQHPKRVKRYSSKERSSSLRTKKTPLQDTKGANITIGGGNIREGRWDYKGGFWTKMFKSEMEKVAHHKSLQSLVKCSRIPSLLASPSVELHNSHENGEDWSSELGFPGRTQQGEEHNKALTKYPAIWITGKQFDWETPKFESKESDDVVEGFDPASDIESSSNSQANVNDQVQINATDEPKSKPECLAHQAASELCNLDCTAIIEHINPEVAVQVDNLEQPGEEFPQSLLLLDEALPAMDHEGYFSMFDAFQDSNVEPATHLKQEMQPGPSSLCISQQTSFESMGQENPARDSEEIELERTLMDIVLHTIFQDFEAPLSRLDHTMSPMSREKISTIAQDKEEAEVPEKTSHWKPPEITPSVDKATDPDKRFLSPKDQYCQTLEHKVPAQFCQRTMSQAHGVLNLQSQYTQEHQATQTQVCWNHTGVQTSEASANATTSPMLVPVYISQFGPPVVPFVHYAMPLQTPPPSMELFNVQQASVNMSNQSTQAGSIQPRIVSKAVNFQSRYGEGAPKRFPGVAEFPRHGKLGQGNIDSEEESESEWDELKMNSSSPVTPSTPLSSPGHNTKLKKALEICGARHSEIQVESADISKVQEPMPKVSQKVHDNGHEAQQILECEQKVAQKLLETEETHKSREGPHLHLPQQSSYGGVSRRGTSWARVKEMEEAALSLLRTVLRKTPAATSSSEYSCDSSPSLCPVMSPGEMKTGARDGRIRSSGEVPREEYNRYMNLQTHGFGQPGRSYVGNIRTVIPYGEPPSEGEVEAGAVLQNEEAGEIQGGLSAYTFGACFRTETEIGRSEPGELHVEIDCMSQMRAVS